MHNLFTFITSCVKLIFPNSRENKSIKSAENRKIDWFRPSFRVSVCVCVAEKVAEKNIVNHVNQLNDGEFKRPQHPIAKTCRLLTVKKKQWFWEEFTVNQQTITPSPRDVINADPFDKIISHDSINYDIGHTWQTVSNRKPKSNPQQINCKISKKLWPATRSGNSN